MFDRCALLMPDGADAGVGLAAARAVVAPGGHVALVGWHRPRFWHLGDMWSALDGRVADEERALEAHAAALRAEGYRADAALHLADDAPIDAVPADADLVVLPAEPLVDGGRRWTERLLDAGRTVAWARGDAPPLRAPDADDRPHAVVAYVGPARRALPAVAALRRLALGGERLTLLHIEIGDTRGEAPTAAPDELGDLIGWPGPITLDRLPGGLSAVGDLDRWLADHRAHVLAVLAPPAGLGRALLLRALGAVLRPLPTLIVPAPDADAEPAPLDGPDLIIRRGRPLIARLDTLDALGAARRAPDRPLAVVAAGEAIGTCALDDGLAPLPDHPALRRAAVVGFAAPGAALDGLLAAVRILRRDPHTRIALFDAEAPVDPTTFARFAQPDGARRLWVAVRLDPAAPCRDLRARLDPHPVAALIDAGAVLEDGDPDDLPAAARPLRLARVARHLRAAGHPVDLIIGPAPVGGAAHCPLARWNDLTPAARRARVVTGWIEPPAADDPDGALRALTDARPSAAHRVRVEFDNGAARRSLLARIDGAVARIDLQTYIFEPDPVGLAVSDALQRARDRGVVVRVLVDPLFSGHGAMGRSNPALVPLEARGCLRVIRPFTVPGLDDLKRRDHRKLFIVDRRLARITGRNVGAPYYTGFDEVKLTPDSLYRDVPWLDAGAELQGPVVREIVAAFDRHWWAAGGEAGFPAREPEPFTGGIPVWLVQHESMRDTRTLDAYRHLIDRAERRITVVNTFPLQFELQQALRAALARGVAVRFLVGHVRPLYGPERTPFRGGAIRSLATEVIHGRLDTLIAAGAEARGFTLATPHAPELTPLRPHVHAKLMSVDGRRFAIGSANLDITAGYWESEALLIVDDARRTARLDARLDALLAAADPIDADPRWQATAARRTWVSRHWPSLLG